MKMNQFYFANEGKLSHRNIEEFFDDSVMQQQEVKEKNGPYNKQKAFSQSVSINNYHHHAQKYIGPYHMISSIKHLGCLQTQKVQFADYLCIKQKPTIKGMKRTELSLQSFSLENIKEKLYLLCKSVPKGKQQSSLDFYQLKRLFQEILLADNSLRPFANLIFPSTNNQLQSQNSEDERCYVPFSMSNIVHLIDNIKLLGPLRNLAFSQKFQSQLFCLNLFYRFLLTILKPLLKIINIIHEKYGHLEQTIAKFLEDCLVIENVFYQERTNQIFLFCNCQRYGGLQENKESQQKMSYKIDSIQKRVLSKTSVIFWTLNSSLSTQKHIHKHASHLHNSFMSNFLFSIKNSQLNFQQTVEILQSKQKRKAFIGSKLQETQFKQVNNLELFTGVGKKRKLSYQMKVSETVDVNSHQAMTSQDTFKANDACLGNDAPAQKQKSVRRNLKQKRNTIDVMLQNYCSNKDVPPSFLNRSLEKKGRLFRHEKSVNKSKSRDRSYQSYFERTQKGTLDHNYSLNYSSSKKKVISSHDHQLKNSRYELSCKKNLFPDKSPNRQVSKTIQIAEISHLKERLKEKPIKKINETIGFQSQARLQNNYTQKVKSFSFVRTNPKSSKLYLKDSTQNITAKQHVGSALKQEQQHKTFLNSKENIFIRTDYMNKLSNHTKKVNWRYYYQPSNCIMGNNKNQSIRQLIEEQMELHRVTEIARSKEMQLLSRIQQKALVNFNRQFGKSNYNNQNQPEKSLSRSKLKEFNDVKIARNNPSYMAKKPQQINNTPPSQQVGQIPNNSQKNIQISQQINLLKTRQYEFNSREFLNTFSPPKNKSKKGSKTQAIRVQFSPSMIINSPQKQIKIDDSLFKAKFASCFTADVNATYKKTIEEKSNEKSKVQAQHRRQIPNILYSQSKSKQFQVPKAQVQISYILTQKVNWQSNESKGQNLLLGQCKKVENQYLAGNSTLRNMSKMIVNNVEGIFVEHGVIENKQQQKLMRQQQIDVQQTKANEQNIKIKEELLEIPHQRVSFTDDEGEISEIEMTEKQEMENMISPIQPVKMGNSNVTMMEIDEGEGIGLGNQLDKKVEQGYQDFLGKNQYKLLNQQNQYQNHSHQLIQNNYAVSQLQNDKPAQQPIISQLLQQEPIIQQNQLQPERNLKPSFHQMSRQEINQSIQQAQVIQKEPIVQKTKKSAIQIQEKKKNEKDNKDQEFAQRQKKGCQQQTKLMKKEPKKLAKIIINDEDNDLEEIKLVPVAKNTKATDKKTNQTNQKQPSLENQPKQLKQTNHKDSSNNQPPLPPKQNQQPYQPSQSQQPQKLLTSKHSAKSSQASSYGPHKTVKKIVQQYIYFINRIGQAVAKSALVSKKVQKVCQWYVGVYFLYKRFFYQRRKIEKYLKQGIPKLTRYDEEINQDEWELYLKSNDRQQLLKKVSQENVKITQSIQKMQGKLMGRKVSDEIKKFSGISSRSSQQSLIAIQAVIDEFDQLSDNGMLKDEQILSHCTGLLNACLVLAQLDKLTEDVVPITELAKVKRTPQELDVIAQDLFELYHPEEGNAQHKKNN